MPLNINDEELLDEPYDLYYDEEESDECSTFWWVEKDGIPDGMAKIKFYHPASPGCELIRSL